MRVRKLPEPTIGRFLYGSKAARDRQHPGPWCCYRLNAKGVGIIPLRDRYERRRLAGVKGIAYEDCGHPATHEVDDRPMCERHAAAAALEILLAEAGS